MITVFKGKTVNEVWEAGFMTLLSQAEKGYTASSRDGDVVGEITEAVFCVEDPTRNIVSSHIRNMPMRYAVGELAWYLAGSNKVKDIAQFSKVWERLSDNGVTNNSAYGYRIFTQFGFDQWEYVRDMLTRDPLSRQAILHIKTPDNKVTKDTPCTVYLQFLLRDNKLNMSVHMRSNDIWMGVPYDMFSFCFLQMKMAMELGVEIGEYTHYAGSLHMYKRDYETAQRNVPELGQTPSMACQPTPDHTDMRPHQDS